MNPTMAALILSLESVFSALSGFVILHQVMSVRELLGCVLMFVAIILASFGFSSKEPLILCMNMCIMINIINSSEKGEIKDDV